jgi:MOSC domain-containing protein YiiM
MKVQAICIGQAEKLVGKSYKTGINKRPLSSAVLIDAEGLVGDSICNRKYHGGPEQAVYVEGAVTLEWWGEQLGRPIPPGIFGENIVIDGLDNRDVCVGDRFVLSGGVVLEATSARIPCNTFSARMGDPKFAARYSAAARPGFYCRVIMPGAVAPGEEVEFHPFEGERITIPDMMRYFGKRLPPEVRSRFLSAPIHARIRAGIEAQ